MSLEKKFTWRTVTKVTKSESLNFQNWMEKDHFPKIHNTRCFAIGWKKIVDTETMSKENFDLITYTHWPMSKAAWEIYNTREDFRPALRKEFSEKYEGMMNTIIFPLVSTAGDEIYEEEETTNDA